MKFNFDGIPTGSKIDKAIMNLHTIYNGSPGREVGVHRLTRGFDPNTATWNRSSSTVPWTGAGGDYVATPSGTTTVNANCDCWVGFNLLSIAQDWANGIANVGIMLKSPNETYGPYGSMAQNFYGNHGGTNYPWLDITWHQFGGANGIIDTDDEAAELGAAMATQTHFQALWDGLSGASKDYMLAGDDPSYAGWSPRIDKLAPSAPTGITPSAFDATAGRVEITWDDGDDPDLPSGRPATQSDEYHSAYRYKRNGGWSAWTTTDESGFTLNSTKVGDVINVEARSYDRAGNAGAIAARTVTVKAPPTGGTAPHNAAVVVACVVFCPEAVGAAAVAGTIVAGVYVINGVRVDVQKKKDQDDIEIRQAEKDLAEAEKTWNDTQVRDRRKLRKDAGDKVGAGEEAHHIIAVKAKAAAPARRIAFKCGMDLNNFDQNGINMDRKLHRKTHTKAYYDAINRLMQRFDPDDMLSSERCLPGDPFADRSVRRALKEIARQIKAGNWVG